MYSSEEYGSLRSVEHGGVWSRSIEQWEVLSSEKYGAVKSMDLQIPENGICHFRTLSVKLFLQRLQLISRRLQLILPGLLLNPHCTVTQSANSFCETIFEKLFLKTA